MPQIDFVEPFAEKTGPMPEKSAFPIFTETEIATPAEPPDWRTMGYIEPARFRRSQVGRSEWINLSFAAVSVLAGLFSAFSLFNGWELFRNAATWPRAFLYASPLGLAGQSAVANGASAKERPRGVVAPKTDPTGDPFPHVGGPLTFDRSPYTWAREAGGLPGTLISRLTLLVPGTDALTQSLRTAG